jgi:GT2 family glycosyltransferase
VEAVSRTSTYRQEVALRSAPTILIVSYGRPDLLGACLDSVGIHAADWPVRVWDNASPASDQVRALASGYRQVHWTFSDDNLGFAAAVNRSAAACDGDVLLLNPDAQLTASPGGLCRRLQSDSRVAATAPFILTNTSTLRPWDNTRRLPGPVRMIVEYSGYAHQLRGTPISQRYRRPARTVGYASGACLLIRRSAWDAIGPFDEKFWLYGEEVDWARRARRSGWRIELVHEVMARHAAGGTLAEMPAGDAIRADWLFRTQRLYLDKHYGHRAAQMYDSAARLIDRLRERRRAAATTPGR